MNSRVSTTGELTAVKSADRTFTILEYLAAAKEATFASIVRELGLPNSSGHQLLQTALHRGYIEFDEGRRVFRLGFRLWEIAQCYVPAEDIVAVAQPFMNELRAVTKETVQLARLEGLDTLYLAIAESPHPMKLVSAVGARLAAHATALGKVLLAALPEEELARRLRGVELARFTERTITDHAQLEAELQRIRVRGYGEDNEEYVLGCRCIAVPVRTHGSVAIAMSVSVPTVRYDRAAARSIRQALGDCVAAIERRGHPLR
jgi:DNA-binding IclR family transcriptional regulator